MRKIIVFALAALVAAIPSFPAFAEVDCAVLHNGYMQKRNLREQMSHIANAPQGQYTAAQRQDALHREQRANREMEAARRIAEQHNCPQVHIWPR